VGAARGQDVGADAQVLDERELERARQAQSSPIVSGVTDWKAVTNRWSRCASRRPALLRTSSSAIACTRGSPAYSPSAMVAWR
jgi:hypothetical protein